MKNIIILGSTGSIGTQTIEIIEKHPDRFRAEALCAHSSWEKLARQAISLKPSAVAIADERFYQDLKSALKGRPITVFAGEKGIMEMLEMKANLVVVALVGISGLLPTLKAMESGKSIALANKETLVTGGELVMAMAKARNIDILPIDSEHSAIFQCLRGENPREISRIHLTSSGGPFRNLSLKDLERVTSAQALIHPNWSMGRKVTIDSSTLMNKGFEVIEARWLFDLPAEKINVVVHPQSIIHSMVEFIDGSIMAQLSRPDMRIPIQLALSHPERLSGSYVTTDLIKMAGLTFEEPDRKKFPCLNLAFSAIETGGTMPAVLNGANEVAVDLFLKDRIGFNHIPRIIESAISAHIPVMNPSLSDILSADKFARKTAEQFAGSIIS